jgi:CNT family concentrative nucleoside transporter
MSHLNLISLCGIFVMLFLAWLVSSNRRKLNFRIIIAGLLLQFALAAIFFTSQTWTMDEKYPDGVLFAALDAVFGSIKKFVEAGSGFVFTANESSEPGSLLMTFAFGVLPTVIFFASLMAILYHLGVMQILIRSMAWVMGKTLGTSGPESMAAAANVLVGHTEAPLVIKPYISKMTRSELNALMVGGFSTISGSLMAIFVDFGVSAGHLLTASIISAPAALVIAKIMQPETEQTADIVETTEKLERPASNVIEAAAIGASEGMKLAINIAAMLIAFLALLAMLNALLMGAG